MLANSTFKICPHKTPQMSQKKLTHPFYPNLNFFGVVSRLKFLKCISTLFHDSSPTLFVTLSATKTSPHVMARRLPGLGKKKWRWRWWWQRNPQKKKNCKIFLSENDFLLLLNLGTLKCTMEHLTKYILNCTICHPFFHSHDVRTHCLRSLVLL